MSAQVYKANLILLLFSGWLALWTLTAPGSSVVCAQDSPLAQTAASQSPIDSGLNIALGKLEVTDELLRRQIQNLNSPSYRTRQQAIWYLEQNPAQALPLLREAGQTTDLNIGAEVISMLSTQAMSPETRISVAAHEALKQIAGGARSVTAVSQLANNALAGIADRQELLATQALIDLGVRLGDLNLTINGAMQNISLSQSIILYVNNDFKGRAEHLRLFRFLRSYDTAYLEGDSVNEEMVREVLAMPALRRLVLRGSKIDETILQVLFDARELEHLELAYAPVDDRSLDTLVDLPLVGSLRIFGTKISAAGGARIKSDLDGLEIYIGRGGFLGVQTSNFDLRISQISRGSAAELGGMLPHDTITHINGKRIRLFEELRAELANFAAGEHVTLVVERPSGTATETLTLDITLGEQATQSN